MGSINFKSSLDAFYNLTAEEEMHLDSVYERIEDSCRVAILLRFGKRDLWVIADGDHDTVTVSCREGGAGDLVGCDCISGNTPWNTLVGHRFSWGWVAINQQGYPDGVMLGFDRLTPQVLLLVAGSSIRLFAVAG